MFSLLRFTGLLGPGSLPRQARSTEIAVTNISPPLQYDFDLVAARLAEAGMSLLALHVKGIRPAGMRGYWPDIPGSASSSLRPSPPSPRRITEMDEALSWIALIPADQVELRKLVGARALTNPFTEKAVHSWRALGEQMGCSHFTAKTRWIDAIRLIVARLNQPKFCDDPRFRGTRDESRRVLGRIGSRAAIRGRAQEVV